MPPILQTRRLSIRFGGVTAVCGLDLSVEANTIFSIIGPNGAGKTTLFNAISGLVAPTAGSIHFSGHDLRRTWSRRATAACLAVGLMCGLALAAVAADLNGLWRAAVRRPASFQDTSFSLRESRRQLSGYLRGDLAIERRREGRWQIVTADGRTPLGVAADKAAAESSREQLDWLSRHLPAAQIIARRGAWEIRSSAHELAQAIGPFSSRLAADERLALLAQIDRGRARMRRLAALAFGLGVLLGAAGIWTAWRRARWTPELVARAGIARTFQNLRLFRSMTARENVLVALGRGSGLAPGSARNAHHQRQVAQADALLRRVGLAEHGDRLAGQLPYGDQRRLEIARALATRPRLLLLDEPAAGMNAVETAALMQLVRGIRAEGVTVLLIEHQMELVMGISDRIAVLDGGQKIAEGSPEQVRRDPAVLAAYLGEPA